MVTIMGEIRGVVSGEVEEKFRKLAMKKFGYGKGSLSKALEEALRHWIEDHRLVVKGEGAGRVGLVYSEERIE